MTPFAFAIFAKVSPFTTTWLLSTMGTAGAGAGASVATGAAVCQTLSSGLGMLLVTSAAGCAGASGVAAVSGVGLGATSFTALIPVSGFPRSRWYALIPTITTTCRPNTTRKIVERRFSPPLFAGRSPASPLFADIWFRWAEYSSSSSLISLFLLRQRIYALPIVLPSFLEVLKHVVTGAPWA